ncbi:MAG: hypothetical protein LUE86_07535, partial [Clostridiales bacterium]|nr:hypothetical protein [Clostridiales bacterium]
YTTLLPDEAGVEVSKTLSPEESMLLYLYQNSGKAGKTAILTKAKTEYYRMQAAVLNRPLKAAEETDDESEYSQMSLSSFLNTNM